MKRFLLGIVLPIVSTFALTWSIFHFSWLTVALGFAGIGVFVYWQLSRVVVQDNSTIESVIRLIATVLNLDILGKQKTVVISVLTMLVSAWLLLSATVFPGICESFHILCNVGSEGWYVTTTFIVSTIATVFGIATKK